MIASLALKLVVINHLQWVTGIRKVRLIYSCFFLKLVHGASRCSFPDRPVLVNSLAHILELLFEFRYQRLCCHEKGSLGDGNVIPLPSWDTVFYIYILEFMMRRGYSHEVGVSKHGQVIRTLQSLDGTEGSQMLETH